MSRLGRTMGRFWFFRSRGVHWVEGIRPWVLPILGGGASVKYLFPALEGWVAMAAIIVLATLVEGMSVLLGWWEERTGAIWEQWGMAVKTDPYKAESLELLRAIRDLSERR